MVWWWAMPTWRAALCLVAAAPALVSPSPLPMGNAILRFAADNLIGPVGMVSVVAAMICHVLRPDLVLRLIYVATICAIIFLIIRAATCGS